MTREEFKEVVCSLDADALGVLDGEVDGFDLDSPFNPSPEEMGLDENATEDEIEESLASNYFYNFDIKVDGSSGKVGVSGSFAVADGYVDRIVLNDNELYHIGASPKDPVRQYSNVSKMDAMFIPSIMQRM